MAKRSSSKSSSSTGLLIGLGLMVGGGLLLLAGASSGAAGEETERLRGRVRRLFLLAARILGIEAPELVFTSSVNNASSDGTRVLVNLSWLEEVLQRFCGMPACVDAVVLGILAHELVHHSYGDAYAPLWDRDWRELRADQLAGAVLAVAGAAPEDFARVIHEITTCCDPSYPLGSERREAIQAGYDEILASNAI